MNFAKKCQRWWWQKDDFFWGDFLLKKWPYYWSIQYFNHMEISILLMISSYIVSNQCRNYLLYFLFAAASAGCLKVFCDFVHAPSRHHDACVCVCSQESHFLRCWFVRCKDEPCVFHGPPAPSSLFPERSDFWGSSYGFKCSYLSVSLCKSLHHCINSMRW